MKFSCKYDRSFETIRAQLSSEGRREQRFRIPHVPDESAPYSDRDKNCAISSTLSFIIQHAGSLRHNTILLRLKLDTLYNTARTMATQRFLDSQTPQMNLSGLHTVVSSGTDIFKRPVTIINCTTQDKYIIYASCQHCHKGVQSDGSGYYCPVHQWQCVPVYRFTLCVLLSDWEGARVWAIIFDELATKVLGFNTNTHTGMASDADRFASLSLLRGSASCRLYRNASVARFELHHIRTESGRFVILLAGSDQEVRYVCAAQLFRTSIMVHHCRDGSICQRGYNIQVEMGW